MSHWQKQIVILVAGMLLCFHFFAVFLYTAPINLENPILKKVGFVYCYPYFHQSWQVFVPAPVTKQTLYVRYKKRDGSYSAWQNILHEEVMAHRRHRLSGYETTVLLFSNSLIYLKGVLPSESKVYEEPPKNSEFVIVAYEAARWLQNQKPHEAIKQFELLLSFEENGLITHDHFLNLKSNP